MQYQRLVLPLILQGFTLGRDELTLDRPCRLQGKVELNNEEQDIVHVELDVPGRGFHFLRWVRRPDGGIGLVIAPPQSQVVFVTHF